MARSWSELLGETDARPEADEERRGLFGRLRESLGKSRRALTEQIVVAAFDPEDDASWERLEEALIYADVGVRATAELIRRLEARQDLSELSTAPAEEIAALFGEGEGGGDPAAVACDAVCAEEGVVLVDTAGRMHTQSNLMDELSKVRR